MTNDQCEGPTASWDNLQLRAAMLRRIRRFFDERGFLEVETPVLSADTVIDRHLDPFPVTVFDDPAQPEIGRRMWLQTSPEFAMKRLLAAGAQRIYQVTRAFRAGEQGDLHNPEFTMVEWYRTGDSLQEGMQLLAELARNTLDASRVERSSYQQIFLDALDIDPHTASASQLEAFARSEGITPPNEFPRQERDAWLDLLMVHRIEPRLGIQHPVIVYDYPASQAALAQVREGPPPVAERFELYSRGIELAHGYHELLDAEVLRRRNERGNAQRKQDGKQALPCGSRMLAAMRQGLPPCSGVALGFDRLVMLAAGADRIQDVMAFPIDRA